MRGLERSAAPPPLFGPAYLDWFRAITERNWAARQQRYFEGTEYAEFGSAPWQQHAGWLDGLSDEQIETVEHTWSVRFPPDWRLFLRYLHAADRPEGAPLLGSMFAHTQDESMRRPFFKTFNFYNWFLDAEFLREYLAWPLEGLLFSIEHSDLWHEQWGRKYPLLEDRKRRVTELVAGAPKLIPIFQHRYIVTDPCFAGNPVLSVHQSDIIPYGLDLRDYFFNEFGGITRPARRPGVPDEAYVWLRKIPFWGAFL